MVIFFRSVYIFQAVTVLIIRLSKNKKFCDQNSSEGHQFGDRPIPSDHLKVFFLKLVFIAFLKAIRLRY